MEVLTPRVNANDDEATLVAWHISPWQKVSTGDAICSIETTKASVDVEAMADGFAHPAVREGETVKVGQILAWVFPEKSDALLEQARQALLPAADADILISAKARALMDEHGLTGADFPGFITIAVRDVESLVQERNLGATDSNAIIAGLPVDEKSIVIWGGGYQGQVVLDILTETGAYRPVAIVDRRLKATDVGGVPVLRPHDLPKLRKRGLNKAHICIGKAADKIEVAKALKAENFSLVNVIHPSAVLSRRLTLGENVFIGPLVLIGVDAVLADLCQVNNAASVAHHSEIGRAVQVSDGARIGGLVKIGEGTLVGIGVVVNSRISVGPWSTLVSGITVFDDVAQDMVVRADGSRVRGK